ncbi:hypothetical protein LTR95_000455 [Oleoguttula sp. CCFEE 5521]
MASFLYPSSEGPRYVRGHAVTMSLVAFGSLLYTAMYFYFARENKLRAAGKRDELMAGLTEDEVLAFGDENPRFVYSK